MEPELELWIDAQSKKWKNNNPHERWKQVTNFTSYFRVPDLSPSSIATIGRRVYRSENYMNSYLSYRQVFRPLDQECSRQCKQEHACRVLYSSRKAINICAGKGNYDILGAPELAAFTFLTDTWYLKQV